MGHFVALSLDWCTSWTKTSARYPLRLPTISNCDFIFKFTLLLKTWKFLNYGLPGAPYSMSFHCLPCFVPSHALLICVLFSFWLSWYLFITKTAVRVCFFIWYGGPLYQGPIFHWENSHPGQSTTVETLKNMVFIVFTVFHLKFICISSSWLTITNLLINYIFTKEIINLK